MKQNSLLKEYEWEPECKTESCSQCQNCQVIDIVERAPEAKMNSLQLYAKEAESYFFYYALCIKEV